MFHKISTYIQLTLCTLECSHDKPTLDGIPLATNPATGGGIGCPGDVIREGGMGEGAVMGADCGDTLMPSDAKTHN